MRFVFSVCAAFLTILSGVHAHTVDLRSLPLGDGQVSQEPRVGSVYACQTRFNPNAPGARRTGDWLNETAGTFDLTRKPTVDGNVVHLSELEIAISGTTRIVSGNGLPDHPTGQFPIARTDDAYFYDRNPNSIRAHTYSVSLPLNPVIASRPSCLPMGAIGIMLTGAVLFNALDARGENALAHEILDRCQGHPQQSGLYHYHGKSPCQDDPTPAQDHSTLIGYALDGFGIYGYHGEGGQPLASSDLDECHGHIGSVMINGEMQTVYHYHATPDYPYTLSCFRGVPTSIAGLSGGGGGQAGGRAGPQRAPRHGEGVQRPPHRRPW
ncbi:MAG: YHYH protein [Rhodobiaceae bacterium]|nr:YHYH protein [Rhodobiaceae bacterium]